MALVQEPTKIITEPEKYWTTIYGVAGTGKTTFASQISGHYCLLTEPGATGLSLFGETINTFQEFLQRVADLIGGARTEFKDQREVRVVVVDTYDRLLDLAEDYICTQQQFLVDGRPKKYDRIEDVPWGKGYKRLNEVIRKPLVALRNAGLGLVVIAHCKTKMTKWRGQDVEKYEFPFSDTLSKQLENASDTVGFFQLEEEVKKEAGEVVLANQERWAYWQPGFQWMAKHRLATFPAKLKLERTTMWADYCQAFQQTAQGLGESQPQP